jgi:hypothetical protein
MGRMGVFARRFARSPQSTIRREGERGKGPLPVLFQTGAER